MRIDKFINAVNLTKRRAIAQDMIAHDAVWLNGAPVKPAKAVKVGDVIEFRYLESTQKFEVLQIPVTKSIPKSAKSEYVKEVS